MASAHSALRLAKEDSVDSVKYLLDQLIQDNKLDSVATITDSNNNNILHIALLKDNPEIAEYIINKLGTHINALCKCVNNDGNIPLDLTSCISNGSARTQLINLLLPKTLDCSIKKISQQLDEEEVIKHSPEALKNPTLMQNLKLGCHAINLARKEVTESATHPQFNKYTPEKKFEAFLKIYILRKNTVGPPTDLKDTKKIHSEAEIIKKAGIANCGEYSLLTHSHLLNITKDNPIRLEIVSSEKGDHEFNVIGRKETSDINDPTTWGDSAVIVDAWSGEAYPATQAFSKLSTYKLISITSGGGKENIDKAYNLCLSYNKKYHTLAPVEALQNPQPNETFQPYINSTVNLRQLLFSCKDKAQVQAAIECLARSKLKKLLHTYSKFCLFKDALPIKDQWKADMVLAACKKPTIQL